MTKGSSPQLHYVHVDVFAPNPFAGNSLPVFIDAANLAARQMLAISRELRHFEAIFVTGTANPSTYRARVFDLVEELPFAGHPVLGAAGALHHRLGGADDQEWTIELPARTVTVATARTAAGFFGQLDQGPAEFCDRSTIRWDAVGPRVADAFGLELEDLEASLPPAVVSTGLRYLIVPVRRGGLERAVVRRDLSDLVESVGAQFAVLLDADAREIRHWNNDGVLEDVATGSAAGTVGAYRLRYCGARSGEASVLHQGRFVGRPSQLIVEASGDVRGVTSVKVGGDISIVGRGCLERAP